MQLLEKEIDYPSSDGLPMADSTLQFDWIAHIKLNLDFIFRQQPDIFVAGDLLWYPVEGEPRISQAPDVMVVFGRPKGERPSYIQHREAGIGPQVVFEIVSHRDTFSKMLAKLAFYEQYGIEEYYQYDAFRDNELLGWIRQEGKLARIREMNGWISPRLGIHFTQPEGELKLLRPDGKMFADFVDIAQENEELEASKRQLETQNQQLGKENQQLSLEKEEALRKASALAQQLRELGIDPERL